MHQQPEQETKALPPRPSIEPYDVKSTYTDEIEHRINEIRDICRRDKIPLIMVFQTKHDGVPTMTTSIDLVSPTRCDPLVATLGFLAANPNILQLVTEHVRMAAEAGLEEAKEAERQQDAAQEFLDTMHQKARDYFDSQTGATNDTNADDKSQQ